MGTPKPKESAVELLRKQAEEEANAELAKETANRVPPVSAKPKAEKKVAPVKKATSVAKPKAEKKAKMKVGDSFKLSARKKLNELETPALEKMAKGVGVDLGRYKKLSGGLRKMSIVNSTIGTLTRSIEAGELTQPAALAKIK